MGIGQSKSKFLWDPKAFATPVEQSKTSSGSTKVKEYDFVIVGGGTAGCVLASRLSEDLAITVLLIEAGKSNDGYLFSKVPAGFPQLFFTDADWAFFTSPQKELEDRVVHCPRGKVLGGSSSINALIYHHASPSDYDEWERNGAEGWSYRDLRPYFLKSECFTPSSSDTKILADEHGTSGPWQTKGLDHSPITKLVLESCRNVGIPISADLNTPRGTMGATACAAFIDSKGQRSSAATAYLTDDVLKRPNLSVAVGCCVEKVLFEDENGTPRAIGVELRTTRDGPLFRVSARKEVVLSAGAYGTPHLLLVSGVGPRKELEGKAIQVVKDLPAVGKNLVDHPSTGAIVFRTVAETPTNDYLMQPLRALLALAQWFVTGKGPMAALASPGAIFVRSDDTSLPFGEAMADLVDATSGPNSPDLEIVWFPLIIIGGGREKAPSGVRGISMSAISLRPQSFGEITLKSNDIWDKPIIDPKWFSNENDMQVLIRGMRVLFKIARTKPLASHTDLQENYEHSFLWPGSANPDTTTDEELKGYIRKHSSPAWHPACTARMGKSRDSSVVNPKLQVHGISSLRIVDASIFPNQISGHPCAPIIAISEKASDIIKEAHSIPPFKTVL